MSAPQTGTDPAAGQRGVSGNTGGRPKGLAKATRELVGEDGIALVELWSDIAATRFVGIPIGWRLLGFRRTEAGARWRISKRWRATRLASKTQKQRRRSSGRQSFGLPRQNRKA
jgi:hypothetical protein